MSNLPQEGPSRRRTSQRMRLKLLRNLDQYKILNPYKQRTSPSLPPQLVKQLKKLTHLSTTSIRLLSLPASSHLESNILQMELAHQQQETRFKQVFGKYSKSLEGQIQNTKQGEGRLEVHEGQMEGECQSQAHPTHPSLGSAGVHCKEEFHLHLLEDRSNLHLPDDRLNLHHDLFESRENPPPEQSYHHACNPPFLFEDYEQYFNS